MYAIVEIAGKQFRVEKNKMLRTPLLHVDKGGQVIFDRVLFYSDDAGKNVIGQPLVDKLKVAATIVDHGREKTVIVFKKKRRKGYQKRNGHRQHYSLIYVNEIGETIPKKITAVKAEPVAEQSAQVKEA